MGTWEQYVPDNRPYKLSQGRFFKTYRSQVFLSAAVTCGLCKSWGVGFCRCHDRRRTTSGTAAVLTVVSAWNTGKSCWTNTSEDIIDTGTAAGIYDLRRLKIRHCAEPVGGDPRIAPGDPKGKANMETAGISSYFLLFSTYFFVNRGKSDCAPISAIILTISALNFEIAHA